MPLSFEEELRSAVRRIADHGPTGPVPDLEGLARGHTQRPTHAGSRRRAVWVPAAAAAAAALIAVGVWAAQRQPHQQAVTTAGGGTASALPPAPIRARADMASAWTGSAWLLWGGSDGKQTFADGASFDPETDRWTVLPPAPIAGRIDPVSVWTGHLWIIWGGTSATSSFRDGAAFDPSTGAWRLLPEAPGALPDDGSVAPEGVWTGRELIVVTSTGHAAAYQPSTGRWQSVAAPPGYAAIPNGRAVWTGTSAVFLLGSRPGVGSGVSSPPADTPPQSTDAPAPTTGPNVTGLGPAIPSGSVVSRPADSYSLAAYDPGTGHWTELPSGGMPADRQADLVWTGRLLLALDPTPAQAGYQYTGPGGGYVRVTTPAGTNAAYDPSTGSWSPLPAIPASLVDPGPVFTVASAPPVWTGASVLLWVGDHRSLAYTPGTGDWSSFSTDPGPARLRQATAWTGTELLGWGGFDARDARRVIGTGVRYRPTTAPAPSVPAPTPPTPGSGPATIPPTPSAADAAACQQGQLEAELKGVQGATGNLAAAFWLADTSHEPCVLRGPARVDLLDASGRVHLTATLAAFAPVPLSADGAIPARDAVPSGRLAYAVLFWPTDANAALAQGNTSGNCPTADFVPTTARFTFAGHASVTVSDLRSAPPGVAICGNFISFEDFGPLTSS